MQRDQVFERVGQMRAMLRLPAAEAVHRRQVGVRQVVHVRQLRAELLAVRADAAHRHAAEAHTVIAAFAPHQPHAMRFTPRAVIGQRDLQRGVGGLRAGIDEEDMVHPFRRHLRHPGGGFEGDGVAQLEGRREIHHRRLLLDGFRDLPPPMAGVAAPEAGRAVQDLLPLRREVGHALGAGEHAGGALEVLVVGVGHPEGVEVVRARRPDLVHGGVLRRVGHRTTRLRGRGKATGLRTLPRSALQG